MTVHARYSPSASHRWATCTASVGAIEADPEAVAMLGESSEAADEGTFAHSVGELLLRNGNDAEWALGHTDGRFTVDDDMVQALQKYLDYVRPYLSKENLQWLERGWKLYYGSDDEKGYADVTIYDVESKTLHVFDLKYGFYHVSVQNNSQFLIYAGCAYEALRDEYDIDDIATIEVHVCQPRINNFDSQKLTVTELFNHMDYIRGQACAINSGKGIFAPSESACHWCPLSKLNKCKAQRDEAFALVKMEFDDIMEDKPVIPELSALSDDEIAHLYEKLGLVESFIKKIYARAQTLATEGRLTGFKEVEKLGNRKWVDTEAAAAFMSKTLKLKKDQVYSQKPISPPQLEKIVKIKEYSTRAQNKLATLITRPKGTTIVPVSDERPAISYLEDEFDVVEETTTADDGETWEF